MNTDFCINLYVVYKATISYTFPDWCFRELMAVTVLIFMKSQSNQKLFLLPCFLQFQPYKLKGCSGNISKIFLMDLKYFNFKTNTLFENLDM